MGPFLLNGFKEADKLKVIREKNFFEITLDILSLLIFNINKDIISVR